MIPGVDTAKGPGVLLRSTTTIQGVRYVTNIEKLLAVQDVDLRIADIERELKDIPQRKDEELTRLEEHKQALDAATETLKAKEAEIHQLELEVDAAKAKIGKLRQQQLDLKTNKEFRAIEQEVATLERTIRGFEDDELVLMETLESLRGDVSVRQKALAEEEAAVASDVKALDHRAGELEGEIAGLREERDAAAAEIDDAIWLERYDAIRPSRGTGIVKLEGGICSGCHMKLPPSAVHDVHKSDTITTCDYCGRLLY